MSRNKFWAPALIVLAVLLAVITLLPSIAGADIPFASRYYGEVKYQGEYVEPGSQVVAWIDGVTAGPWTTVVFVKGGVSQYVLDIPFDNEATPGEKDGGVNGDIVNFGVVIGTQTFGAGTSVFNKLTTTKFDLNVTTIPPTITTTNLPDGKVGDVYSVFLSAVGGELPYTWNVTGLPAGLAVTVDGEIAGTPTVDGDFNVDITLTDNVANTDNVVLPMHVYPALVITTTALDDALIGEAYNFTMAATGGMPPLTWVADGLPAGLVISAAGEITGIPTEASQGTPFQVTFTVSDSFTPTNTDVVTLGLTVVEPGDANGDGIVNIADATKVERIILGFDPPTPGADANQDGVINIADVTYIELIILGVV